MQHNLEHTFAVLGTILTATVLPSVDEPVDESRMRTVIAATSLPVLDATGVGAPSTPIHPSLQADQSKLVLSS